MIAILVMVTGVLFYACKENLSSDAFVSLKGDKSVNARIPACSATKTLVGSISANRTLDRDTLYYLDGVVQVTGTAILTIEDGTIIQGIKDVNDPAFLIVNCGAQINAVGLSNNPIVFTSNQAANSRSAGDWGGLVIQGCANNNNNNSIGIPISGSTYTGGGSLNTSSSGTMEFVRVEFAGFGGGSGSNKRADGAFILNSLGDQTTINHIQVSQSAKDGITVMGGRVNLDHLISYNAANTDYNFSYGYVGNVQFVTALRLNNAAAPTVPGYGIDLSNFLVSSSEDYDTKPVISNATILGPNYCSSSTVDSDFKYAVRFYNNAAGKIYNSVFSSWNTASSSGLLIEEAGSIAQTSANNLEFSYNSFHNSGTPAYLDIPSPFLTWNAAGGCGTTMTTWIAGTSLLPCREAGNQLTGVADLDYDETFCSNFCESFTSNFILGEDTDLDPGDFTWTGAGSFTTVNYRGAFNLDTDWTRTWAEWCPRTKVYCE